MEEKAMDETDRAILIYSTFPGESDALKMGRELVEAGLAACVNILPGMTSMYRWEGAIETANEAVMLIKTRKSLQQHVLDAMAASHPYSVPALIVFEPQSVAAPYWEWLRNQTHAER
jgi:periplasmic divalent cation tolerance protein